MHIVQITFFMSLLFGALVLWEALPPRGVKQITVIELREMLKNQDKHNYQYIDVRQAGEFNRMHVFGFKNIPIHELAKEAENLSKDKRIIIMSERGIKGNDACKMLKKKGFTHLSNVRGGFISWEPH